MSRTAHASGRNLTNRIGLTLVGMGSTVLVAYSAVLAWQFHAALNASALDALGSFASMGLASLRALQVVALDHTALLSVVHRILVLCSAFVLVVVGAMLARSRSSRLPAASKSASPVSPEGEPR